MKKIVNKFLGKFNLKLVGSERHTCEKCNRSYSGLPRIMGDDYVYEKVMDIDRVSGSGEYEPHGWIVESRFRYNDSWTSWTQQWNYKVYLSDKSAMEALIQLYNYDVDGFSKIDYRLVPVYILPVKEIRRIKINKIINKN